MKTILTILFSLVCSVLVVVTLPAADADQNNLQNTTSNYLDSQLTSQLLDVGYISKKPYSDPGSSVDTTIQQAAVLEKINEAVSRGAIKPQQASDLKGQLNGIGARESWYKSLAMPVPPEIIEQNTKELKKLSTQINKQSSSLTLNIPTEEANTADTDIHKLIGLALASNKIDSSQAIQYYSRLAQIENETESLKSDPVAKNDEKNALTQDLAALKADVQKSLK